jgi:hypothetical protein
LSLVKGDFNETVLQGFSGGAQVMGSWRLSTNGNLTQADSEQYFARYEFPLEQRNESLLYRVQARSLDSGWVGYGIHLYTDNSRLKGYGFGEGLLVWVTRDPEVYGTNRTYIEVYRSRDDVDMERVLHAAISESIEEFLDIEILYEPEREYITMSVNGEEKVRYKTWFDVDSGVNTALRSLGRAEFRNLTVRSR